MTRESWSDEPFAVHVSANGSIATELISAARAAGASVVRLDLAGVRDRIGLADRLAQVFLFPHKTRGLDAAADLLSDLEWLGNTHGYLLVVEASGAAEEAVTALAGILPAILDRWRAQGRPFVVVLADGQHVEATILALARANHQLHEAGKLVWAQPGTGPVAIVEHGSEREP